MIVLEEPYDSFGGRRRANVQQPTCEMVWSFSFYYLFYSLFYSLFSSLFHSLLCYLLFDLWKKTPNFKTSPGGEILNNSEQVWICLEKREKCEKVLKRFCPLVIALQFFFGSCWVSHKRGPKLWHKKRLAPPPRKSSLNREVEDNEQISGLPNAKVKSQRFRCAISQVAPLPWW